MSAHSPSNEDILALAGRVELFAHSHGVARWSNALRCRRMFNKALEAKTPSSREFGLALALTEFRRLVRQLTRTRSDQARRKARQ